MGLKEEVEEIITGDDCYITLIRLNPNLNAPELQLPEIEGYEVGLKSNYDIEESASVRAISENPSSIKIYLENVTIAGYPIEQETTSSYNISQI